MGLKYCSRDIVHSRDSIIFYGKQDGSKGQERHYYSYSTKPRRKMTVYTLTDSVENMRARVSLVTLTSSAVPKYT